MTDSFSSFTPGLSSPATKHYQIDVESGGNTILDPKPRLLYVLTDGNLELVDDDDVSITYPVVAGQKLDFRAAAVGSGTTADVAAWY